MTAALVFWGVVLLFCLFVLYLSSKPGYRRRGRNPEYCGEERRTEQTESDYFDIPIFDIRGRRHSHHSNFDTRSA